MTEPLAADAYKFSFLKLLKFLTFKAKTYFHIGITVKLKLCFNKMTLVQNYLDYRHKNVR